MPGALEAGLLYAELLPANRAKFHQACCECGARPKEWCEQRSGTIHSSRGSEVQS